MDRVGPCVEMELSLFAPPDLSAMYRLRASGYDYGSEYEAVNIIQGNHYETRLTMESLHHLNVQPKILKRMRNVKLRRLEEYKHAFIQFLSKRLSLSRSSPQISFHKMEQNFKDAKVIANSTHKKTDFNIPVINHDVLQYEKKSEFYSISSYSKMNRCNWLGTKVTVRKILSGTSTKDGTSMLKAEAQVLGQIRHPYILLLLATTYDDKNNLMLLYENIDHGSLYAYLHEELRRPSEDFILSILDQIAQVLLFLHQSKWIHTNLTSHAIQVMSYQRVKLSCFELATHSHHKTEINPQSNKIRNHLYNWQAPEYYTGLSLGEYTDIFQFGLLTWEIIQRKIPWNGLSLRDLKEKYQLNKQAIMLNKEKAVPQLISIMDQSLNINPEERSLTLNAALKLISSAKSSSGGIQTGKEDITSAKEINRKCNAQSSEESHKAFIPHTEKEPMCKADTKSLENSQSSENYFPIINETRHQFFESLENAQDNTDSFTGLRRVSESNFKTYYARSMKEHRGGHRTFSVNKESKSCHSSEKLTNGGLDISGSTQCQQDAPSRNAYYRSISASNYLNRMTSSMKTLPLKAGTSTSSGIKPASHSLEKQLSSSSSQEFSWSCGSSTPYQAFAIKPASHQSERGFPRIHKKTVLEENKSMVLNNNNGNTTYRCDAAENQSYLKRRELCTPFLRNERKDLNDECEHQPKDIFKNTESLFERFSKNMIYPSLFAKETGEILEEFNLNQDNNKTWLQKNQFQSPNHEKNIMPNLLNEGEPEVTTKLCEKLLIMINPPHMTKKENGSLEMKPSGADKTITRNKQATKDCCLNIPIISDACIKKLEKPLPHKKRPSSKLLKILGLNLMEFYQDDELGPSLWNDENMQLGMCHDFGNSFERLLNIEEFSVDQHNDIILRSEDMDVESDPELKIKCQFNPLYYTLNQKVEEDGTLKKEELQTSSE